MHLLTAGRDVVFIYAAGEAESGQAGEPVGAREDLDDLYGGDAVEAAGEAAAAAAAAAGDLSDDAEVGASCLVMMSLQGSAV